MNLQIVLNTYINKIRFSFSKKNSFILRCILFLAISLAATGNSIAQEFNTFEVRYEENLRGDLTFIGNSILNRDGGSNSTDPNDPYNNLSTDNSTNRETGGGFNFNDIKDMQYIDVDGDASTFSSSTSTLTFEQSDCNIIRYAALYWAATYPSASANGTDGGGNSFSTFTQNNVPIGTGRQTDFNQVRFKVPGGTYVDITADEVLYDGFTSTDPTITSNSPYACFADVTDLVTALANPEGEYTVANIRATTGILFGQGGSTGGWTLVIVYENPTLSGKFITTFDGFARVNGTNTVDIDYSGFSTIPVGPVKADFGAATLEGDFRIDGDGLSIQAASNTGFTPIGNAANPTDNFFNSNITLDGAVTTSRNPASLNTLGYDTDIFQLNNPANAVIPNDETAATFRFSTDGDQYYPFFNSFNIEVIEPNIVLEKRVEDIAGNDITGLGVNLGQTLDYVLSFQNIGNDNAINYTIRDILPINVTLDEVETSLNLPPGVTYTYNPAIREVAFTIPDNLVEEDDPVSRIRMRVRVAENCFDFVDACTDQIQNIAFSTYFGEINNAQITDDPSVNEFDACGFPTAGATNFLLDDLEACDFSRTVLLCGDSVVLDAGNNFDSYVWYVDENEDGLIDAGDTLIVGADTDMLVVTETGVYIVDKIVADPCKGFQEVITVTLFGETQTNPITALINDTTNTVEGEIVICSNDGEELPEIFLCGLNDTELIQINIPDADSIEWEQLDEASCAAANPDCANRNNTCTWNVVETGSDFIASDAGQYRITINYTNGCFSRFFFNIFKNPLNPQFNSSDIICDTPGNITVTNLPLDYEFQLVDATNDNILVPYSANNGPSFSIATNGAYRVEMRQQGVNDGCVFILDNIGILDRDFQVEVETRDTDCNGLGEIQISILNVEVQYYYEISQGGTTVDTFGPSNDNNYTFENLNDGVYDILATTDDGCSYTEQVTINDVSDIAVSAITTKNIDCEDGIITVTGSGGFPNPEYAYAIWSYNGTDLYTDISEIPASEYQSLNDFIFTNGEEGDYEFVVIDGNNCPAFSNIATIVVAPSVEYTTTVTDETCFGDADGQFSVNITNSNGYSLDYTLTLPDASTISNSSGIFTGLGQGDYSVTITQTQGSISCDFIETFTISGPIDSPTATVALTQEYTCLQNGIIEVQNVSGGTAPYEYSIDGINFDGSTGAEIFNNLTDGTYTISIRDSNGCVFVASDIIIEPLNPPTDLTFASSDITCPALVSNIITTVVDGNAPFIFEIIAPSSVAATSITGNSADFDALSPDTYTFRVTDAKNCVYEESFTIAPITPITAIGQLVSNITCFDDTDGEARFTVSGFATSYDYTITGPSNFSGTNETNGVIDLTALDDGTYTINVTDNDTNCTETATVTINGPPAPITITIDEVQPTCIANGSALVTASGGWGSFSYTLNNPDATLVATNTTGSFSGLAQFGTYNGTATDINGCVEPFSFNLIEAVAPVLTITPNSICYDDAIGLTLTATVSSGGDGNFEFSLNNGPFDTNNIFSGLSSGTYRIDVRDGNNCTGFETITINPELSVTATAPNITACGTDAAIDITAAGGDGNYVYAVVADGVTPNPGDFTTTNPFTVTSDGDYDVYVRDNSGNNPFCEASFDINITQDAPIAITPTVTDINCFGDATGSISIAATGGEAPYTYNIDGGAFQTSPDFLNLAAGTYAIIVRDANNCEETASVTVNQLNQIIAEAALTQNYTCIQDGEITVGSIIPTTGGSGNYQYSINGGAWTASTTLGHAFVGLIDGTYTISVRDANNIGCVINLPDIIIAPLPTEPTLSESVTYNCDGSGNITVLPNDPTYTYNLDAGTPQASNVFSNVAVGNHVVTVDYGSSCTIDINVVVEPGNAFEASIIAFENLDCTGDNSSSITIDADNFGAGGFEYSLDNFATAALGASTTSPITINSLAAGSYTITLRDVDNPIAGCTITLNQTITEPTLVVADANITTPFTCNNGGATITASASGGTPSYQYQLENDSGTVITAYQTSPVFSGLTAGSYVIRARDNNLCEDSIDTPIIVVAPELVTFDAVPTACYTGNNNGTIEVTVTNGNGGYLFQINGGPWLNPIAVGSPDFIFNNLSAGTYNINVRDQFGCEGVALPVTINPQLNASANLQTNLTCIVDATIEVTATGGSGVYIYEWGASATGPWNNTQFTGNIFTSNSDGTFYFRVTDNTTPTACIDIVGPITVNPVATPVIATVTPTNILCNGENNGSLDVDINTTIGNPPYVIDVIEINGPTNYGTQTTGLPSGDYEVTITDDNGCISLPFPVSITEPTVIVPNITNTNLSCSAGGNVLGTITVNASGGTPTYIYEINNNDFSVSQSYDTSLGTNNHTFTGLDFGDYAVTVTDDNNCQTISTVTITTGPDVLITTSGSAGCLPGSGEMRVEAQASNGTLGLGNFFFAIHPAPAFNIADPAWFPEDLPPAPANSHLFTGLIPGVTYTFIVYDTDTGCEFIQEATVPVSSISTLASSINLTTDITCTGFSDGTVEFTISGYGGTDVGYELFIASTNVTTGITGSISGVSGGPETDIINGIPPGEYFILFTENSPPNVGCVTASENFTIGQAPALLEVIANSPTNDNCNPNAGVITATAQFGAAPYEFQYLLDTDPAPTATSPGWVSATTANVESGNYIVYVRDVNDCIQSDPVTVVLDPSPDFSYTIIDECVVEGSFQVLITLDNPLTALSPFQISVNGSAHQNITFNASNQYLVSGLNSGLGQTISVRDLNGCSDSETLDIQTPLEFTAIQTVALDCEPGSLANAEIEIEVLTGSGNYEYLIDGPGIIGQTRTVLPSNPFTWTGASAAGLYDVTVFDLGTTPPNCQETVPVNVPDAILPVFTETNIDVTCNGGADGSITLIPIDNGINPLTFTLTPMPAGSVLNGNTFENLPAGTYSVRAMGINDCFTDIFDIEITEPGPIVVPAPTVVEFACIASGNNPNNASITIDGTAIVGGSNTFITYEFIEEDDPNTVAVEPAVIVQSGSNTTFIETDFAGGSYTINVYDSNSCIGTTTAIILPFDELLTATATFNNDLSCNPGNDGSITVVATSTANDTTRFEYSIDNGANYQVADTFTGLAAGNYTILVRHIDTGCIISATETITEPDLLELDLINVVNIICFGDANGRATLNLNDGTGTTYTSPIDYTLYQDVNNTPTNLTDDTVTTGTNPDGDLTIPNLVSGSYFIEVAETNFPNCTYDQNFNIAGPPAAITGDRTITPISCNPGSDGIIEVINVAGGWGDYQYYVSVTAIPDEFDAANYSANPRFENLAAGTYEIWVIDINGCPQRLTDAVLDIPTPIIADLQINDFNCINLQGEIEVVGIPATNPISGGQGSNYTFQLIRNGSNIGSAQNTTVFSGLGAGSYEVYIVDQLGCELTVGPVVLTNAMSATAEVIKPIDCTVDPGGQITISVTGGSANLDYTVTFPDLTTTVSQNNGVFTNLTQPGLYTFLITDLDTDTPCTVTVNQSLDDKVDPVLLDAIIEDVSCFGESDGSITAILDPATATNPIYSYELYRTSDLVTPIRTAQTSPLFENLDADSYQIRVISERSCEAIKIEIVNQPNELTAIVTATDYTCAADNTVNTAILTIAANEGTAPYLYSIDNINFQTTNTFEIIDNSAIQTIDVHVVDANGCSFATDITINPLNTFTAAVAQNIAISCANPEELAITVTETGAPGDSYTFELLPVPNTNGTLVSNTNTSAVFNLTQVGSYTFRVTNTTTGCYVDTAPYNIAPFDTIDVIATATAPVSCFGTATGELELNIIGYSGNYNYQIFDSANNPIGGIISTDTSVNPRTIPNISGGNYYVRVTETDLPLCQENSNTVTIVSPATPLATAISTVAPVTCTNDQGEIFVIPSGGFAPYDIVLTNTTTGQVYNATDVNTQLFSGLSAGSFTVDVSDSSVVPCIVSDTETLAPAIPITADITATPTTLLCFGDTNATVTAINVINGEGVYLYQLNQYDVSGTTIAFTSGAQSSPVFDNLGAGIYSITVSDGWNCGLETVQVTISEPTDVMASLIQLTPLTCTNDASIELTAIGGTAPYEFSIDGNTYSAMSGGDSHIFNVADGVYQYYVRDSFGCEAMISNQVSVDPVPPLTITIDDNAAFINCTGEASATIIANVTGGLGDYSYELYTDMGLTNLIAGPQTNDTFSDLAAGSYYVRVTSEDCEEISGETLIVDPTPLQIDREESTNVTCPGLNDGTINVEVSGGSGEIQYAITPNLNQFDTVNTFDGLAPGVYDVIAQDMNGCFIPFQFTIVEPMPIVIDTVAITNEICEGDENGSVEIAISGGTAPYSAAFNSNLDADFVTDQTFFTDLAAGAYVIIVRDALGCEENITVEVDPGVNLNASVTPVYECSGIIPDNFIDITLEDETIANDVLYAIDSTDPSVMSISPDFTNLSPGAHFLAIAHVNGCINTIEFEIDAFEPLTLTADVINVNEITAIATGGVEDYTFYFDGINNGSDNTYMINRTDTYTVRVVDQNGCELSVEVFAEFIDIEIPDFFTPDGDGDRDFWAPENSEGFPNILTIIFDRYGRELYRMELNDAPWNGVYQSRNLPSGDYWYIIKLRGENDPREIVGHFTLYR